MGGVDAVGAKDRRPTTEDRRRKHRKPEAGSRTFSRYPVKRRDFLATSAAISAAACAPGFVREEGPRWPAPSKSQLWWQRAELGLFTHFGINTYTDREWGDGHEDARLFNPVRFDARQWARAARAGGFRYVILTAKHHDGFCLWPSKYTEHSVKNSPWRDGHGDVVREFVNAMRAEGLRPGLYLSPWDRHERSYGDGDGYNRYYIAQLTELLTQYGPIVELFFDGANGEGPNGKKQLYDWPLVHRTVRRLQPDALMFSDAGPDIRWIGNERGTAGDPNWCTVNPALVPYAGFDSPQVGEWLQHGNADGAVWRPGEADVSIRPGWFHHEAENAQVRSTENLMELYFASVGRNANLLLNVPPTRDGLFHEADAGRLAEFGERMRQVFANDFASRGRVHRTADGVEIALRAAEPVGMVVLREEIASGQSVARYRVEALVNGAWSVVARGTTIGHKKIDRFGAVTSDRWRIVVEESAVHARLGDVGLFPSALASRP
jgi:alpha-L-fucosidase